MSFVHERTTDAYPYVHRFVDSVGDGSGNINANVDGSVTPILFKCDPPVEGTFVFAELTVIIEGSGNFTTGSYGGGAALTNGLQLGLFDKDTGEPIVELTAPHRVRTNVDWALYAYPVTLSSWGAGTSHITANWDARKAGGAGVALVAGTQAALGVKISDDLTGLGNHFFVLKGYATI